MLALPMPVLTCSPKTTARCFPLHRAINHLEIKIPLPRRKALPHTDVLPGGRRGTGPLGSRNPPGCIPCRRQWRLAKASRMFCIPGSCPWLTRSQHAGGKGTDAFTLPRLSRGERVIPGLQQETAHTAGALITLKLIKSSHAHAQVPRKLLLHGQGLFIAIPWPRDEQYQP